MEIKENIPLSQYTTLKIGGTAKFFCEAKDENEIEEALKFAKDKNLSVFILGGGSNILVSDKGFDGIAIKIPNSKFQISNSRIICDGGVFLSKAVNESVKAGLTGLEWAAGIPGTVGGAVRGNAGAPWGCMADSIESVRVLKISNIQYSISNKNPNVKIPMSNQARNQKSKLKITEYKLKDCKFDYRNSVFKQDSSMVILSVKIKLKKGDKAESERKIKDILVQRKEKQPMDFPSSGSFFANPATKDRKIISEFEKETNTKVRDNKNLYHHTGEVKIPAAYLIEEVGLKGKKIGGAQVSEKHANFIINTGKAKAEDFIILAAVIKTRVRNKFGIQLKEEVQMVGF